MMTKDEMKKRLAESVCTVIFEKKDGTLRTLKCTLMESMLPPATESNTERKTNDAVLPVWDTEKEAWRSFRLDTVKEFTVGG